MQLEQEIASIIKYTLINSGNPAPYYDEVPEGFIVPAVYFPQPEIDTRGDTLSTYTLSYIWFIKFFHVNTPSSFELGLSVMTALQNGKSIIPLIDNGGNYTGQGFRLKDQKLKEITSETGVVQLTLSWNSHRLYDTITPENMEELIHNTPIMEG